MGLFYLFYFILFLLSFDFAAFFPHYFRRGFYHFLYWNALGTKKILHFFSPFFVYTYFNFISLSFFVIFPLLHGNYANCNLHKWGSDRGHHVAVCGAEMAANAANRLSALGQRCF